MANGEHVRLMQEEQGVVRSAIYDAMARGDESARDEACKRYEAIVAELEDHLGPNAHCADVDCDLYGFYSDCYKDRNGFRPRGFVTRKEVLEWLDADRTVSFDDDDDPCVGMEDFTLVASVFPEPLPYEEFDNDRFYTKKRTDNLRSVK